MVHNLTSWNKSVVSIAIYPGTLDVTFFWMYLFKISAMEMNSLRFFVVFASLQWRIQGVILK